MDKDTQDMTDFTLGFSYAYAPHNLHPFSLPGAMIDFANNPTDPYSAGYATGTIAANIPVRIDGSIGSVSTLVWVLASKAHAAPVVGIIAASEVVDLQVKAGMHIAEGGTKGKDMYTGMRRYEEQANTSGYNLIYQPGGGGIPI